MATIYEAAAAIRTYALALPGAHEDFPWGERVVKVKGKVFVFLGRDQELDRVMGFSVKLPASAADVLARPNAEPTGYGLGKAGWVSVRYEPGDSPDLAEIYRWIDESWAAVAPKRLAKARGA